MYLVNSIKVRSYMRSVIYIYLYKVQEHHFYPVLYFFCYINQPSVVSTYNSNTEIRYVCYTLGSMRNIISIILSQKLSFVDNNEN